MKTAHQDQTGLKTEQATLWIVEEIPTNKNTEDACTIIITSNYMKINSNKLEQCISCTIAQCFI